MNTGKPWGIEMNWPQRDITPVTTSTPKKVNYLYNGFSYSFSAGRGVFAENSNGGILVKPEENRISFNMLS
jgi:hypothetical protein